MADSPVFALACEELERRTALERLAARGTVRIALKKAGLDVADVDATQMMAVLRRVLPAELKSRGIEEAERICEAIAATIAERRFEVAPDRASQAAETIGRFGD
ncbi:MAG TPA: hypothetical protein VIN04_11855 [Myxococcota bacterium]